MHVVRVSKHTCIECVICKMGHCQPFDNPNGRQLNFCSLICITQRGTDFTKATVD